EATSDSKKSSAVNIVKPLSKTRILDYGQQWEEKELSFSISLESFSRLDDVSKFTVRIKTPESPLYETYVYKGWHRNFDVGARKMTLSIIDADVNIGSLTISLTES
ncbi:hypothetical protein, partial [Pseudomonas sp. 10S4]